MKGVRLWRWGWAISLLLITGCAANAPAFVPPAHLSDKLVPKNIGVLTFQREPTAEVNYGKAGSSSLLTEGRVYSIRHDDIVEGSLQLGLFKPAVEAQDPRVLDGIERTIAEGTFEGRTVHGQKVNIMRLPDQNLYLWFPPKSNAMSLLVIRRRFRNADTLMRSVIEYQQGRQPGPVSVPPPTVVTALPTPQQAEPGLVPVLPSPGTPTPSPTASSR